MDKLMSLLKALYMSPLSLPLAWLAGRTIYRLYRYMWPKKRVITNARLREISITDYPGPGKGHVVLDD